MHTVLEKYHFILVTMTPIDRHKTQHMSCTWSVCVCMQNFAVVRHGV